MPDRTPVTHPRSTPPAAPSVGLAPPLVLWSLRGATDDLRALVIETSFGYALGLELDAELIALHLQPNEEVLVAFADRIETALRAQGWITSSAL